MSDDNPASKELPHLYSMPAIGIATFFGSLLAGGFLISANYRALGMKRLSHLSLGISLFAFCLSSIAVSRFIKPAVSENGEMLQLDLTIPLIVNIAQVIALVVITNIVQGSMLSTFTEMQGKFHSTWRAVGLGLIAYIVMATLAFFLLSILGLSK
jgi:hypothetical protein